jgi:hypothetical protein
MYKLSGWRKTGCGGLNNIAFVASLRRNAATAGIKYLDTGAVPEGLIELPALPDEITGVLPVPQSVYTITAALR